MPAPVPVSPPGWYPDPGGTESLRYWDGASWTHHQAPGQPEPAPPAAALPLSPLARGATVALAAHGLVVVAALVVSLDRIAALGRLAAGSVGLSRLDFSDRWYALTALAEAGTYFIAGVAFILWFRRAYRNLSSLGAFGMRFKPGWAVGGWFVPFLNLVRPKQVADEIWRGTDPASMSTNVAGPTAAAASPLLTVWWVLFLVQAIGGTLVARLATAADVSVGELRTEAVANALLEVVSIGGLVAAVILVQRVTARHEERRARLVGEPFRPVLRRALPVLSIGLLLGGALGGAFAAASLQSDDDEPAIEAVDQPEAEASAATLDDEVLESLDRACFNTDQQIASLEEPESLEELAAYYAQLLDALRARDAGLRAAAVPAELRSEYDAQFVEPAESSTAEVAAVFQPIIDAARAGDAATVEQLGNEIPETLGQSPAAAAYATAVGAGACAGSFAPADEGE